MSLEFWFEFASPYSYPAAMRIEKAGRESAISVIWRPFLLGPIFRDQGWLDSPFNIYPAKGRYMWRDLERICQASAIPFKRPSIFPRHGLLAARVACCNADQLWLAPFVRAVFRANFAEDREISDPSVIADCLISASAPTAEILKQCQAPEAGQLLRAQTARAAKLGIFGAPFFVVGDELFWGNDRLEDAVNWCREPPD